ncbi:hypothetical protein PENTCL1PPCAC_26431 [Pristionchus entomophagus]|uniref:Methyltransferase domain-containing protein n=1 Tax=Pristionchus entomophagus TaxID=358040 RepID=A0AAV5UD18_9BILA|nr:hypothetical protein PENTCL1PPCAC_26431 [Pristionchus entomophagus]
MMETGRIAGRICTELKWLLDLYIIDFYVDELWKKIPSSWKVLDRLTDSEWSRVMDENGKPCLTVPLPLSIICLRSLLSEYSLVNRSCHESLKEVHIDYDKVMEYESLTVYEKRRVKEKKRDEIERVVPLLRILRDTRPFSSFVDIGSGLGHLTRAIVSSIPDLNVRGVEGSEELVERAIELDEKRSEKRVERMRVWVDGESKELLGDHQGFNCYPEEILVCSILKMRMSSMHGVYLSISSISAVCVGGLHACGDLSPFHHPTGNRPVYRICLSPIWMLLSQTEWRTRQTLQAEMGRSRGRKEE